MVSQLRYRRGFSLNGSAILIAGVFIVGVLAPGFAFGKDGVKLSRAVFVEKTSRSAQGLTRALEPAEQIRAGDKLVLMVEWKGPRTPQGFTIASRIPSSLSFQRASSDAVDVSVDGGKSWGKIGSLRIGSRLATPEDVTNIRWAVPPSAAATGKGRLTYSALVKR